MSGGFSVSPKVLIVDDSKNNLFAFEQTLGELDAELILAESARKALDTILSVDLAVIVLDVQMPGMDGFELASKVRENAEKSHIPIIFVTASDQNESMMSRGYKLGAVDYLFKPVHAHILLAKLRVFCELFSKNFEIEHLKLQEIDSLKSTIRYQKRLLSEKPGSGKVGDRSDSSSVKSSYPKEYATNRKKYSLLLEEYLDHLTLQQKLPGSRFKEISDSFGSWNAGAKDLIDLHISVVQAKTKHVTPKRAMFIAREGRLFAIEMIGHLCEFYRSKQTSDSV